MYKRQKLNQLSLKRYISHVQANTHKEKFWVCAHLSSLYNSFTAMRQYRQNKAQRTPLTLSNFFDYEKWLAKHTTSYAASLPDDSPSKKQLANESKNLLQKTPSSAHVPI